VQLQGGLSNELLCTLLSRITGFVYYYRSPRTIAKKRARSAPYTVWGVFHEVQILLAAKQSGLAKMQLILARERAMSWKRTEKAGAVLDSDNQPSKSVHRRTLVQY
jgi:hypothetical protein